jgi:hypothetical protein
MNRREAVQYLHDRHPRIIEPPGREVDLEALHLEFFWFQMHVCEVVDRRSEKAARRCFETMHELLVRGDSDVRSAVWNHFCIPHLVFHEELAWAKGRMPRLLADLCDKVKETTLDVFEGDRPASTDRQA